jgi:hypothetical protein
MLVALAALFFAVLAYGGTITVTQPGNCMTLTMGSSVQIAWTASGVTSNVKIQLIRPGGGLVGPLATNLPPGSSPYFWTVAAPAVSGEQYRIRVHANDGTADGQSPVFTVVDPVAPVGLTIQSPHGGESWELGSTKKIQWLASNVPVNCRLLLVKDGQVLGTIRDSFAPGQGESIWNWQVGDYQGGPAAAGSGYKVRMQLVDNSLYAQSDAPFTITPKPIVFAPLSKIAVQYVVPGKPDLVACLKWDGGVPLVWQDKRIYARVKNIGNGDAPASVLHVWVEQNGTRDIPVPALAPGAEFEWSKKFDWATCGHKTVKATADNLNQVAESNEGNNVMEAKVEVSCGTTYYQLAVDRCSDQN